MSAVLAIDAAWKESGSSGLALLASSVEGWRCVAASHLATADVAAVTILEGNR
jgi:hypothetical protein